MVYNSDLHHRKSIRLNGYDYSSNGMYHVTICTQDKQELFGKIIDGKMVLNHAGKMIEKIWYEIPQYYNGIEIDIFQIMPDHFHGIIIIDNIENGQPQGVAPTISLFDVVHRFKTMTTKLYSDSVKNGTYSPYNKRVWQRNYYEEIIKNDKALYEIREYIINNPMLLMGSEVFN